VAGTAARFRVEEMIGENPGLALVEPERAQAAGGVLRSQL